MKKQSIWRHLWDLWKNKYSLIADKKQFSSPPSEQSPDCVFVLSVERGKLESQAILLVESLRRFGGRFANSPVYAISPRSSLQMSPACQQILKSTGVNVIVEELLAKDESYGTIARLAACVWAEQNLTSEILVSLDDDMFFVEEPYFRLQQTDFLARPVDVKGMCTTGSGDPFDKYWRSIAEACDVNYEDIPWLETTVDHVRIKASYNGGMIVVRRQMGIFQRAASMYQILKRRDLSPHQARPQVVFASTGRISTEASRWWGSAQAVLSLAATQLGARIRIAPPAYNVPIHLFEYAKTYHTRLNLHNVILAHYHWLLDKEHSRDGELFPGADTLPGHIIDWLKLRVPLREI